MFVGEAFDTFPPLQSAKTMGEVTARARVPGGTKKKWFQVTRFPALFSTGMHGTEQCIKKR